MGKRPRLLAPTCLFLPPKWRQAEALTNQLSDWTVGSHCSPLGATGRRGGETSGPSTLPAPTQSTPAPPPARGLGTGLGHCTPTPGCSLAASSCVELALGPPLSATNSCFLEPGTESYPPRSGPPGLPAAPRNAIHRGGGGGGSTYGGGGCNALT